MDKHEYLEKNAPKITEIISPSSYEKPTKEVATDYNSGLGLLSVAIVSIAGLYFLFKSSSKSYRSRQNKNDKSSFNIFQKFSPPSCKKCRFFNDNSHLECAVHPVRAGNVKAKDCSDYWQKDSRKFWHR